MNRFLLLAASSLIAATAHADTIINLNATVHNGPATSGGGTANNLASSFYDTVNLAAGTYTVSVVGSSTAGAVYNGWSQGYGANHLAAPSSWQERTAISFGGTVFSNADGNDSYSPYPNNDPQFFEIGNGDCSVAGNCSNNGAAALSTVRTAGLNTYTFTLVAPDAVTFYIPDQPSPIFPGFTDNTGGVSLDLQAQTPEPSSLVLLGTGALGLAGAVRRRFVKA